MVNKETFNHDSSRTIIYTGSFRFPDGDAAAARVLGIGKALRFAGHRVFYAGWEECERVQDRQADGRYVYEGFTYKSISELRYKEISPIRRLFGYLRRGSNTVKWLKTLNISNISTIIAYNGGSFFLLRLANLCKKHNIQLIVDCTEWYEPRHLVGGRFGLVRIDDEIRMRVINQRIGRIIPISSFLEKYYFKKGCRVLRIPPLVDLNESKWMIDNRIISSNPNKQLQLAYAGDPAKKDLLGNVLKGIAALKDEGITVELHLAGPTYQSVAACLGSEHLILDKLANGIVYYGRIPQSAVPGFLASSDFTILLRPRMRYAQAGFPTKIVESLAAGVPVITNRTSDLNEFIQDGKEGILLTDYSQSAFVDGIKRAISLTQDQREAMRYNARYLAEKAFDYRGYVKIIAKFIEECDD